MVASLAGDAPVLAEDEVREVSGPEGAIGSPSRAYPLSWHVRHRDRVVRILETDPLLDDIDGRVRARHAVVYGDADHVAAAHARGHLVWDDSGLFRYWPHGTNPLLDRPLGPDEAPAHLRLWIDATRSAARA